MPADSAPLAADSSQPALIVVVDTEEEFDWSAPFDRAATGVGHMGRIGSLQEIFDSWDVRPVYVIDYPVAVQKLGFQALCPLVRDGRALIGAHLHPWVSPPFEEEVNIRNSYPGNLSPALERAKLAALCDAIVATFGFSPVIYKAGRYGIGPNTFAILEELGFTVDLSPSPPFDYRASDGPNYSLRGLVPDWAGPHGTVLSIPGTGALVGSLPSATLYRLATGRAIISLHLPGILARLGIVERLKLSPEGYTVGEMTRLVRWLYARGQRLFVMSLHSPSIEPGHTPYVRNDEELRGFLGTIEQFLRFFMTDLQGLPTDPLAFRKFLIQSLSSGIRNSDYS